MSANLPLELVSEVLNHCQPNELSAVALTNSNYRIEAERVLYRTIVLNYWIANPDLRIAMAPCLSTLAKIQSKADMVKSFELIYNGIILPPAELDRLCTSLVAMRSLKHLKLHFSCRYHDLSSLMSSLKSSTFSLATLYIPSPLLDDWVFSQNQLQALGMLDADINPGNIQQDHRLSICKQLMTQNSSPPTVFVIVPPFYSGLKSMMAFPLFSVNARWSAKDVADSIPWTDAHNIAYFKLLLDSPSEEGTVHDVLTSLAEHFLCLKYIVLSFLNDPRMHLSPSSFSCLHKFPHLETFDIEYCGGSDKLTHTPFHENYLDLACSWIRGCPKLYEITFPDGRMVTNTSRSKRVLG